MAELFLIDNFSLAQNQNGPTGELLFLDEFFERWIDFRENFWRHANFLRSADGKRLDFCFLCSNWEAKEKEGEENEFDHFLGFWNNLDEFFRAVFHDSASHELRKNKAVRIFEPKSPILLRRYFPLGWRIQFCEFKVREFSGLILGGSPQFFSFKLNLELLC